MDRVILEHHCDVVRKEDDGVLVAAYLISHFQTGLKNVLDRAILDHREVDRLVPIERYPEGRRDPLRFPAADHVGGGRDAGGRAPAADQGRPGGDLPPLHPLRARRRRLRAWSRSSSRTSRRSTST